MATETSPITLDEVNAAIRAILTTGASYSIAGRTFTRANLKDLRELRKEIIVESKRNSSGTGSSFIFSHGAGDSTDKDW